MFPLKISILSRGHGQKSTPLPAQNEFDLKLTPTLHQFRRSLLGISPGLRFQRHYCFSKVSWTVRDQNPSLMYCIFITRRVLMYTSTYNYIILHIHMFHNVWFYFSSNRLGENHDLQRQNSTWSRTAMSMLGSVTQLTGTNVEAQRQEPFPLAKFPHFPGDGWGWYDIWCCDYHAMIQCLVAVCCSVAQVVISNPFFTLLISSNIF